MWGFLVPILWEHKSYWYIHQLYHKKHISSIIVLTVMINVWFICLNARYVVSNIQVQLPTILSVGGTIVNPRLEKLRAVTVKISSKKSYRVTFYNQMKKVFLKTWKLDWLKKRRVLTRPRENCTSWEHCILMVWILRVTISSNFLYFY